VVGLREHTRTRGAHGGVVTKNKRRGTVVFARWRTVGSFVTTLPLTRADHTSLSFAAPLSHAPTVSKSLTLLQSGVGIQYDRTSINRIRDHLL